MLEEEEGMEDGREEGKKLGSNKMYEIHMKKTIKL